jgi:hypothetical protein
MEYKEDKHSVLRFFCLSNNVNILKKWVNKTTVIIDYIVLKEQEEGW